MDTHESQKIEQARTGVRNMMNGMIQEVRTQFADGYKEESIILGLHDYLTNYTNFTREEFATLYMEAVIRLAKSGE